MSLRACAKTRPKHRSTAHRPSPSTASTRTWGRHTKCGLSAVLSYTKSPHTKSSNPGSTKFCLPGDSYKSVSRYAVRGVALQLRALCSDHPVDDPSFDEVAQ